MVRYLKEEKDRERCRSKGPFLPSQEERKNTPLARKGGGPNREWGKFKKKKEVRLAQPSWKEMTCHL